MSNRCMQGCAAQGMSRLVDQNNLGVTQKGFDAQNYINVLFALYNPGEDKLGKLTRASQCPLHTSIDSFDMAATLQLKYTMHSANHPRHTKKSAILIHVTASLAQNKSHNRCQASGAGIRASSAARASRPAIQCSHQVLEAGQFGGSGASIKASRPTMKCLKQANLVPQLPKHNRHPATRGLLRTH
eukprot:674820-Pelagomonas_calceolata.AAC.3